MRYIAQEPCFSAIHVSGETVTNIIYDNEQNSIESTSIPEYNEYRDLVKSWDVYANGDKNNTEYMNLYTYDDVYHTQLTKEYKRDGSTTVLEAVGSDYGFRHLTYSEQRNADVYFRNKWSWFCDEIEYYYYLKSIRGY